MNEEIREILKNTKNGEMVLNYIEDLEAQLTELNDNDFDDEEDTEEWIEVETSYKSTLSVKDWECLLKNENIFDRNSLIIMKRMRHIAAPTTTSELANAFGQGVLYYSLQIDKLTQRLISNLKANDLDSQYHWALLFQCWESTVTFNTRVYGLLPALYEALGNIDLSTIPLRENEN